MDYSFRDHFLKKEYVEAVNSATEMLKDAKAFDAIHIIGLSLVGDGKVHEGIKWLSTSLAWPMAHSGWFVNAAMAMKDSQNPEYALMFLERGLTLYPANTDLTYARGLCLILTGRWEEAIKSFDTVSQNDLTYNVAAGKGLCLFMLGKPDEAIALWRDSKPTAEVISSWGLLLLSQAKPQEALALFESHHFDPEPPAVTYNKSFLYLGMQNWPLGWKLYRSRALMVDNGVPMFGAYKQPFANSLDDIRDKHLLLFSEQGLGDSLMFARFAGLLRPVVGKLTLLVPKTLVRLMRCMHLSVAPEPRDFDVENGSLGIDAIQADADVVMPMLDAPAFLETTVETIPPNPKFIIPREVSDSRRLPNTDKPRIGLAWIGGSSLSFETWLLAWRRSMPFETMRPLLDQSDKFTFISLMTPDRLVEEPRLLQPLQADFDMLDTAAIIVQLDLIITIDTVIAHLAGSLGKPVWLLLRHDSDWRWLWDGREDSPWYPNMRLYRQTSPDSWPDIIERVSNDLKLIGY
jgi:hypothetical protein